MSVNRKPLWKPDEYLSSVHDLNFIELWNRGIRGVLLDIDNTLVTYDTPEPTIPARRIVLYLKNYGFKVALISNGRNEARVDRFAEMMEIPAIKHAGKPFGDGVRRSVQLLGIPGPQLAIVGDQLFTDIWAGRREGLYRILTKPISFVRDEKITRPKRPPERLLLKAWGMTPAKKKILPLMLIGDPVAGSYSPMLQGMLIAKQEMPFTYEAVRVEKGEVGAFLTEAFDDGVYGMNVTAPLKNAVISGLIELDPISNRLQAANVLKRDLNGFKGYNTDVFGLEKLFEVNKLSVSGETVLILGAGGAAKAALYACLRRGASEVCVWNRSPEHAEELVREFEPDFASEGKTLRAVTTDNLSELRPALVIQSTSAGMDGSSLPELPEALYAHIPAAVDLIYNPEETPFLRKVREAGGVTVNGMDMLYYQGIASFAIWTGRELSEREESRYRELFYEFAAKKRAME